MNQVKAIFENYLATCYSNDHALSEAIRYSLLAGGKRFRPLLVMLAGADLQLPEDTLLPIAAAIEMIHTYSLIHDDLPALDNDDLRRGCPTNHRVYGEATAILAGDALLTDAFYQLALTSVEASSLVEMFRILSLCAGSKGMVLGQADDLAFEKEGTKLETEAAEQILKTIHLNKTGKLIESCFLLPAIGAGVTADVYEKIKEVSQYIGLWFQIRDDILDVVATTEELGKDAGSDIVNDKLTYVSLYGLEGAQEQLASCEAKIHDIFKKELKMLPKTYHYLQTVMQ